MLAIGCDHAGFPLKQDIIRLLEERGVEYRDFGTYDTASCDYSDYALKVTKAVITGECDMGLLVCGTGVGMSMAANKVPGIRAACCSDYFSVKYTRLHNDANVLCIGARVMGSGLAWELVDVFLNTTFEGGKHTARVGKIREIEERFICGKP